MNYVSIDNYDKGIVFDLLVRGFGPLMNAALEDKLKRYDKEVFANPDTGGASIFLTQHEGELIGLASWDPRQFPKAIIGYNCIVPEHQGKGFGKRQMLELVRRLRESDFTEITARTGDHPFYVPSQKMYAGCAFKEIARNTTSGDPRHGCIDYLLIL